MLKRVLESGCISHKPHNVGWGTVSYAIDLSKKLHFEELIVPTVTCYCDIPFDSLRVHLAKYGAFGVSLSHHHLIQYGARPVTYIPTRPDDWNNAYGGGTALLSALEATYRGLASHLLPQETHDKSRGLVPTKVPENSGDAARHLNRTLVKEILAFIKPYDATLNEADPRYYYSEREWRKFGNMLFTPQQALRVVVHPRYLEAAKLDLRQYSDRIHAAPGYGTCEIS